ncbi:preprotein translocase subunit SecG [bacterium]|nr:preprotein translocase subunit SecG [bacterium]
MTELIRGVLIFIHIIISVVLVVVILLQASKGGGLAGIAGGQTSSALFGARGTASALSTITQYLAASFLILSVVLSVLAGSGGQRTDVVTPSVIQQSPAEFLESVPLDFEPAPIGDAGMETAPTGGGTDVDEP